MGSSSRAFARRSNCAFRAFCAIAVLLGAFLALVFGLEFFAAFFLEGFAVFFLVEVVVLVVAVRLAGVRPVWAFGRLAGFGEAVAYVLACLENAARSNQVPPLLVCSLLPEQWQETRGMGLTAEGRVNVRVDLASSLEASGREDRSTTMTAALR